MSSEFVVELVDDDERGSTTCGIWQTILWSESQNTPIQSIHNEYIDRQCVYDTDIYKLASESIKYR